MLEQKQEGAFVHAILNGKRIAYMEGVTEFLVQVGKNKSIYRTKYRFTNLKQALFYYNGINIGNGYKKRLYMPSSSSPVLSRQFSA